MTKLIGTDVSFYQDSSETDAQIDFKKMVTKTPFVIIRAGQNLWIDPDFLWNMKEAKAAGLLRGSYWFYDSRVNPKTQAALYSSLVTQDHGELPMFADFEDRYNGPYGGWNNWYNFLEELKVLSPGVQLGVYTGPSYWLENTVVKNIPSMSLSYFGQYPLWIAHYGVDSPSVVMPWSKWEFSTELRKT
jgi:GH25 family lysozyme M1 (1,4-beta-N-acetylmuramidase)